MPASPVHAALVPDSGLKVFDNSPRQVPRVRTEVRLQLPEFKRSGESEASQTHGERIDISVYKRNSTPPRLRVHGNGARDVWLAGVPEDFGCMLEVKLTPGRFLGGGASHECGWLRDVFKLSFLPSVETRIVLFVDSGLPVETVGVTYSNTRRTKPLYPSRDERPDLPPWPLRRERFEAEYDGTQFKFEPDERSAHGLFLWALSVAPQWSPVFDATKLVKPIPVSAIEPCRWRVEVVK
jgi:hypothetical protein